MDNRVRVTIEYGDSVTTRSEPCIRPTLKTIAEAIASALLASIDSRNHTQEAVSLIVLEVDNLLVKENSGVRLSKALVHAADTMSDDQ